MTARGSELLWVVSRLGDSRLLSLADRDRVVIGRHEKADVFISSPHVAREHLILERRDGRVVVADGKRLGRALFDGPLERPPARRTVAITKGTVLLHGIVLEARDAFIVFIDQPTLFARHLVERERVVPLVHPFIIGSGRRATEVSSALESAHASFEIHHGSFCVRAMGPTSVNGELADGVVPVAPGDVLGMDGARAYEIRDERPTNPPDDPLFEKLDAFLDRGEIEVATSLVLSLGEERFGPWLDDVEIRNPGKYLAGAPRDICTQVIFQSPLGRLGPRRPLRELLGLSLIASARPFLANRLESLHFDGARRVTSAGRASHGAEPRVTLDLSLFDRFRRLRTLTLDHCELIGTAMNVESVELSNVDMTASTEDHFPNARCTL